MALAILLTMLAVKNTLALTVTCNTKFSSLNHSISKVICPPNCPLLASSTLCGSSVYSEGQICLAAMQDQRIDNTGGLVDVYRGLGQNSYSAGLRNNVKSISCSASTSSYTFKMSCSTNGNSEFPITQVDCPPGCRGSTYSCGTGIYSVDNSVCAAAVQQGIIEENIGGLVTFYKHINAVDIGMGNATSCTGSWFTFEDINECAISNPCANNGTCVDLLAGYQCICSSSYEGGNCETEKETDCSIGVRYDRKTIPDSAMSTSSYYAQGSNTQHHPKFGRLNQPYISWVTVGAWVSGHNRQGEWIQVALPKPETITGVITQGRVDLNQWVTSYKISYLSPDNSTSWKYVSHSNGSDVIFVGNTDGATEVTRRFPQPVIATKLRLYPQTYHNHIALRHEYLIC